MTEYELVKALEDMLYWMSEGDENRAWARFQEMKLRTPTNPDASYRVRGMLSNVQEQIANEIASENTSHDQ